MKNRALAIGTAVIVLLGLISLPVSADERRYEVSDFEQFKTAVAEINNKPLDGTYTISLTGDINFGSTGFDCIFSRNVEILGNGYMIDLGDQLSHGELRVRNNAVLSLGKSNGTDNENRLKITTSALKRSAALVQIGQRSEIAVLNMYDGVELTGCVTNGASLASAVNINNGEFNMYGGSIHENINEAIAGMGGAVAGHGNYGKVTFNMYGGAIRENKVVTNYAGSGGGIFLAEAEFNMYGGEIIGNIIERTKDNAQGYGGGVMIFGGNAVLSGGEVSNNTGAVVGGGIFTDDKANVVIKDGFRVVGNGALAGGGIGNNGERMVIENGAVIANNTAVLKGDDIAHYGKSLTLAPAENMNTTLLTDGSNEWITGWYVDDPRWQKDSAREVDVTFPLEKVTTFLKAAYKTSNVVRYHFESISEEELPDEVAELLPIDTGAYNLGDIVIPIQPIKISVAVETGMWEFKGYDSDKKIIEKATTEFIGSWEFKPKASALNEAPTIQAHDKTINIGDLFDPLDGVSANDKEDGVLEITMDHIIENNVNTEQAGTYNVIYKVSDSQGASVSERIIVTVVEKTKPLDPGNNPNDKKTDPEPPDPKEPKESDTTKPIKPEKQPEPDKTERKTSQPDTVKVSVVPKTGDRSNIQVYKVLSAGMISLLIILFRRKKKTKR